MHNIPVIRLELERMTHSIMLMINEELARMDTDIQAAVKDACDPRNIKVVLNHCVNTTLQNAIQKEVEDFFRYGKGRLALKAAIEAHLFPDKEPN